MHVNWIDGGVSILGFVLIAYLLLPLTGNFRGSMEDKCLLYMIRYVACHPDFLCQASSCGLTGNHISISFLLLALRFVSGPPRATARV
jgi:hypothetical protein